MKPKIPSGKGRGRPPKNPPIAKLVDESQDEKVWLCPHCNKVDDGTPMIGCDGCEDWYHWICVGILVKPKAEEIWLCPRCKKKKKTASASKGMESPLAERPHSSYVQSSSTACSLSTWNCQSCKRSLDKKPSIGCDGCDKWYHWQCVGIEIPPHEDDSWFCRECIEKQALITQKFAMTRR